MKKFIAIVIISTLGFSSCKYEDGPIMSFRSKKNRAAHRIGKWWKSEKYLLKMGQEGYALSMIQQEGFLDQGDWKFNNTKDAIIFMSEEFPDYELRIKQLQHKKLKLEGAFPFDNSPIIHEFEADKFVKDMDQ